MITRRSCYCNSLKTQQDKITLHTGHDALFGKIFQYLIGAFPCNMNVASLGALLSGKLPWAALIHPTTIGWLSGYR